MKPHVPANFIATAQVLLGLMLVWSGAPELLGGMLHWRTESFSALTISLVCLNRPIVLALSLKLPCHVGLCLARRESGRSALVERPGEWLNNNDISG